MGGRRKISFPGLAVLFVCAPGILYGSDDALPDSGSRTFTVRVPHSGPTSKVGFSVSYASADTALYRDTAGTISMGDWEVTVAIDAAQCEVHCAYRRKPDAFGRPTLTGFLLPPITTIQVYTDSESRPTVVIVDPAGRTFPTVASNVLVAPDEVYLPSRRILTTALVPALDFQLLASHRVRPFSPAENTQAAFPAVVALRI